MSSSEIISRDPCTGVDIWSGPAMDTADLDVTVAEARRAARDWSEMPAEGRRQIALEFAALVRRRRDDVARLISRETGKPLWEALTEADSVAGKVAISIRAQAERAGELVSETGGILQALRHRPHGVLAVIGPFNFPMHLPGGHIVPALLAGNTVIFKPSEKTPASGDTLTRLWRSAGLPDGVLQVAIGDGELGRALVAHQGIDGVLFTGGAAAGRSIHQALAGRPDKILALELGGNNPLIAWNVDDAEDAAHLIAQSAFVSAGQRCSCARRLIIPTGAPGDIILAAVVAVADRLRVGGPFDEPAPFLGPVIDNPAADAVLNAAARLEALGGRAIRPARRLRPGLPFLAPALIDMTEARERPDDEIFGPILQVIRAPDFEAAIAMANDTRFGLAAGLIGGDEALYRTFWRGARAGVVNWNRPTTGASSAAPFGGVGESGNHRPSAYYAADYCAYPVAGLESPRTAFRIETGLEA